MNGDNQPAAIFLMGPTAAGKTALAMAMAERFPVEIISVDASQVYRGMDIGTAKPTAEELASVPHHLIDIRDPWQPYSAAEFCADARRLMTAITARGNIPLLAGGTMFYFHSLEFGLSEMPSADPEVRQRLEQEAVDLGWEALHARLSELDPASGARIHANDTQRIQRALEIIELTGQTPSAIGQSERTRPELPYRLIRLALWPEDREALRQRIAVRFHRMMEQGLLAEVEQLLNLPGMDPRLPSMRMVGYRQAIRHLKGETDRETMIEQGIIATRQLAKRQLTWLRSYQGTDRLNCIAAGLVDRGIDFFAGRVTQKGI